MAQQNFRVGRLEQEIQREINDLLLKRIRDPRIEGVTVTGVEVTGDLQQAKIFYSVLSELASVNKKAAEGLDAATGLIRKELGSRLRIYKTPELKFVKDESVQYGNKIDDLIRQLHQD
ncbi:30S ribosome-binding factor RbfA [Weissella paramesenteroides]|jgi:ribosome-binding factor A|uniref:Ribosome-binding factor A n=2 Tax=Weissella paramesenteroides TaxID=1249 RepID=C5RBC3_WEIPA|nr:30S ribosome-binding factor RbfA [Weissella paramesenteroides]ATF41046.1 30S ribosome-binding factor RbfA [Weissella paramesenteroides]EER74480.1 ribosome-binding factor A [Weissella paramesenteroides ATCC 33313]KAA8440832.1 30S ribosome-binding factor RbfA [Weissella paramesenteroides]KAA8441792.1 30S ribosome-binding factor RbfA [Weissella paramesenteroides]KAA8443263.1 30S ribosome-binding factor RbfA [Weissella paramesenteroides]